MQLKSLHIFCDIVRCRSFSRAAAENGISQSSASQVVHQLEDRLGLQLLDRSKRPFVLTPAGEHYYEGCRHLVRQLTKLEDEVRNLEDRHAGQCTVAAIYSVGLAHMSAVMRHFSARYPFAQVRIEYLHPDRVYQAVEAGEVDLGLVSYPEDSRTLRATPWRSEPLTVVCHPAHRLALQQTACWEDLQGEAFVAFEAGLRIRAEIDRALLVHQVEVEVALEFDNVETMKRAIEINEGIGILPTPTVAGEVAVGRLVQLPLTNDRLHRPLGIISRRDRNFDVVGQQFVELLQHMDGDFFDGPERLASSSIQSARAPEGLAATP